MSINGIEFTPSGLGDIFAAAGAGVAGTPPTLGSTAPEVATGVSGTQTAAGVDFSRVMLGGVDEVAALHRRADGLAVAAATGRLENLHDYTLAATEAATATQLTVAVRNKAVEAFQEIMRMPV